MFAKVLVANRGEIALRVIRTCREMGIRAVAVYSDADANALHVRMAHEAVRLGPPAPGDSYLSIERVVQAAVDTGAEAVHPGYGFLAENAAFCEAVESAGMDFIGPTAEHIRIMGDKLSARRAMTAAGVPVVPGTDQAVADPAEAAEAARAVGFPVALKAAAGGGGKGIRLVKREEEIESALALAMGEAESAFGDGRMYVERYLEHTRHIEVQVLGDGAGQALALGERECSVQRRHQKLVEETPSPALDESARAALLDTAVRGTESMGYRGAGTMEFLWSDGEVFFLEMNTRLQVEHPITEAVTGIDLVAEQLRIAAGEWTLSGPVETRGAAIEVRINAEDPSNGYMPSTGTIENLRFPLGPGVRVDGGLYRGMEVTLHYDPLLAKVITWGPDRAAAIARMARALQEFHVGGVDTTASMGLAVMGDARFLSGDYDTRILEGIDPTDVPAIVRQAAAVAVAIHRQLAGQRRAAQGGSGTARAGEDAWTQAGRRDATR